MTQQKIFSNKMNLKLLFIISIVLISPVIISWFYYSDYKGSKNIKNLSNYPENEDFGLDSIKFEEGIPKVIYRTHKNRKIIENFKEEFEITEKNTKGFKYEYFTDEECENFVKDNFSQRVYNAYSKINPKYGACRADLFRYLLIYKKGGIYLDIKSVIVKKIDKILEKNYDKLIVQHPLPIPFVNPFSYSFPPWGEYNQWAIVSPKGHPVLKKIIETIVYNIELESMKENKSLKGGLDVLTLTGPYMFTKIVKENIDMGVKELNFNFNWSMRKKKSLFEGYRHKYERTPFYYQLDSYIVQ